MKISDCLLSYFRENPSSQIVDIEKLSEFFNISAAEILLEISEPPLARHYGVIKRFICPEGHVIPEDDYPYCKQCGEMDEDNNAPVRHHPLYISLRISIFKEESELAS